MLRRSFAATSLAVMLATAATPAHSQEMKMPRVISLTGHGESRMVPDMAVVNAGVSSEAATAAEALKANTEAMNKVMAALKGSGIADRDIQTSNFSVQPRYDYNNNSQPRLTGYIVSNTVTVSVRKIDSLGTLLDQLVQSGSNQINGVSFDVTDPQAALDEARKLAMADATRKAKLYAEAAGVSLGPIMSVAEGQRYEPPMPMRGKAMMAEAAAPVPVAAGEQVLAIDVNVVWEIR